MSSVSAEVLTAPIVKPKSSRDDWTMRAFMGVIALYLVISLAMPLFMMLKKSMEADEVFVGIANYIEYFSTPSLAYSINNSIYIAVITTLITVTLAFTKSNETAALSDKPALRLATGGRVIEPATSR